MEVLVSEFHSIHGALPISSFWDWQTVVDIFGIEPTEYKTKESAPLFNLVDFDGKTRSNENAKLFYGVIGDYDAGNTSITTALSKLQKYNIEALIYSTASHSELRPRWRVICPYSSPKTKDEHIKYTHYLNNIFDNQLAPESFTVSQCYYFGKIEGVKFDSGRSTGITIDSYIDLIGEIGNLPKPKETKATTPDDWLSAEITEQSLTDRDIVKLRSALTHLAFEGYADHYPTWAAVAIPLYKLGDIGRELCLEFTKLSMEFNIDWFIKNFDTKGMPGDSNFPAIFALAKSEGWAYEIQPEPIVKPGKIRLISESELLADHTPPKWLFRKLLPEQGIVNLIGETGTGKSFLALKLAKALSRGSKFTKFSPVSAKNTVILAGEGFYTYRHRLAAIDQSECYTEPPPCQVSLIDAGMDLMNKDHVSQLMEQLEAVDNLGMIIIDTMSCFFFGEENKSSDVNAFQNILKYIARKLKVLLIVVHHTGLTDKTRARGSSAMRSNVDVELVLNRDEDDRLILTCTKNKMGEYPAPMGFEFEDVELEGYTDEDEDGNTVQAESAVLNYVGEVYKESKKSKIKIELKPGWLEELTIIQKLSDIDITNDMRQKAKDLTDFGQIADKLTFDNERRDLIKAANPDWDRHKIYNEMRKFLKPLEKKHLVSVFKHFDRTYIGLTVIGEQLLNDNEVKQ